MSAQGVDVLEDAGWILNRFCKCFFNWEVFLFFGEQKVDGLGCILPPVRKMAGNPPYNQKWQLDEKPNILKNLAHS